MAGKEREKKREKGEKGDARDGGIFLVAVRTHDDRTAKVIKVHSYFFLVL